MVMTALGAGGRGPGRARPGDAASTPGGRSRRALGRVAAPRPAMRHRAAALRIDASPRDAAARSRGWRRPSATTASGPIRDRSHGGGVIVTRAAADDLVDLRSPLHRRLRRSAWPPRVGGSSRAATASRCGQPGRRRPLPVPAGRAADRGPCVVHGADARWPRAGPRSLGWLVLRCPRRAGPPAEPAWPACGAIRARRPCRWSTSAGATAASSWRVSLAVLALLRGGRPAAPGGRRPVALGAVDAGCLPQRRCATGTGAPCAVVLAGGSRRPCASWGPLPATLVVAACRRFAAQPSGVSTTPAGQPRVGRPAGTGRTVGHRPPGLLAGDPFHGPLLGVSRHPAVVLRARGGRPSRCGRTAGWPTVFAVAGASTAGVAHAVRAGRRASDRPARLPGRWSRRLLTRWRRLARHRRAGGAATGPRIRQPRDVVQRPPAGSIPDAPGSLPVQGRPRPGDLRGQGQVLRSRLSNYFQTNLPARTAQMVATAETVEWIQVRNEVEALLLEYTPHQAAPAPVQHPPGRRQELPVPRRHRVATTGPGPMVMRGARKKGVRYFGPYGHAYAIRETLDLLLRTFPVRTCSDNKFEPPRAARPAVPAVPHREVLGPVRRRGRPRSSTRATSTSCSSSSRATPTRWCVRLDTGMREAADELEFERAARLRDRLTAGQQGHRAPADGGRPQRGPRRDRRRRRRARGRRPGLPRPQGPGGRAQGLRAWTRSRTSPSTS